MTQLNTSLLLDIPKVCETRWKWIIRRSTQIFPKWEVTKFQKYVLFIRHGTSSNLSLTKEWHSSISSKTQEELGLICSQWSNNASYTHSLRKRRRGVICCASWLLRPFLWMISHNGDLHMIKKKKCGANHPGGPISQCISNVFCIWGLFHCNGCVLAPDL